MSNEVTEIGKGFGSSVMLSDPKALGAAMVADAETQTSRGGNFMSFSGKNGKLTVGKDKRVVETDEIWLVNSHSFENGWMCWKNSRPEANRMASCDPAVTPVPTPDMQEFAPFNEKLGDGWRKSKAFSLKSVDYDEQAYFQTSSDSGCNVFYDLQGEIGKRMVAGEPCWPLIQIDREEFPGQGHVNLKPKFTIYGWLNKAGMEALSSDDEDVDLDELIADALPTTVKAVEAVEEKKPKRQRKAETPVEVEEEAPRRRRRHNL